MDLSSYFPSIGSSGSVKCGTDNLHLKLKISYFGHFIAQSVIKLVFNHSSGLSQLY